MAPMTAAAVTPPRFAAPPRFGMRLLSAALTLLCAALLLLAIGQTDWRGLTRAVEPTDGAQSDDVVLRGAFVPADAAGREALGEVWFERADIVLGVGATLKTSPERIALARHPYSDAGDTWAEAWRAPGDAQIEVRSIVAATNGNAAPVTPCGAAGAGWVALLHRGGKVDLMLVRQGPAPGPVLPASAVCGRWTLRAR